MINLLKSVKTIKIWLVLLSTILIVSCGGGGGSDGGGTTPTPTPTLSVSPANISVEETVSTESITITTSESWSATNNADWISLSTSSGSGNSTLTLTIAENSSGASRSSTVSITAGTLNKTVTVNQSATVAATLSVTPSSLTLHPAGESQNVQITTSESWTISGLANDDWVTLSAMSGTGDTSITVTVPENNIGNTRSVTLTVNAGTLSTTVNVSQANITPTNDYDIPPDSTDMRDIKSTDFTDLMGVGFNIGNSLDAITVEIECKVIECETQWGNPLITKALVDAIKAAGFKSIRLPVAWSQFSDEANFVIKAEWLNRVEEVVNYALENDMFVMMNIHWDGGWMQPTNADKDYVNNRLAIMWQQIATHFRDYDDRLLFAGTNEVMVTGDYGTPTVEYYTVQNSFNQTFIDTVRKTGGRNVYRQLIVQGFNTNIDHTVNFAILPDDSTANRLLMEVHYYDPFQFTLEEGNDDVNQWGANATDSSKTAGWGDEAHVDTQFLKMRNNYYDKGIGVILGEYGVVSREAITDHEQYRIFWNEYITQAAIDNKLVPFYWDNGYTGNHSLGLFNRATAAEAFPDLIDAITKAGL
ncbi:MAG: cellulase family glycosylhydrolase [Colwellia sp.]